jgi:lipopolysaccharide transport system permease protein
MPFPFFTTPMSAFNIQKKLLAPASRYAAIITYKAYANLKGEIEKTYLGCIWWIAEPLLNTLVFYIAFVHFLHIRSENFTIFLYIGMVGYGYFSNSITMAANAIPLNSGIIQQVYLPKWTLVLIALTNTTWKFLFSLLALFPLIWLHGADFGISYLALPVILFWQILLTIAFSLPISALVPYFPDSRTVLSTVLSTGMWFSGVFYTVDQVPEHLRHWFYLNPAVPVIESYRAILIDNHWPDWHHLLPGAATALVLGTIGIIAHRWIDRRVAKLSLQP